MKTVNKVVFTLLFSICCSISYSQNSTEKPTAKTQDVESIDAIITTLYSVISGSAGNERDWSRFSSLWHPSANLTMVTSLGKNASTQVQLTLSDFITMSKQHNKLNGFHEIEIKRQVDEFGNIATVISSYTIKETPEAKEETIRGLNMFQLYFDGKRWWIMNCIWENETAELKIPKKYLK